MFLLLRNRLVNNNSKLIIRDSLIAIGVLFFQLIVSNWLTIRGIRPDFMLMFLVYFTIRWGGFYGILFGFVFGILVDLAGTGGTFGLTPIVYTSLGYFAGFISTRVQNVSTTYLALANYLIVAGVYFIDAFFRYPVLFDSNPYTFVMKWVLTSAYTLGFLVLLQYIVPFERVIRE